jgi:hypothetical protein
VQVVGYDNSKQAWLVKNSWGDRWASEGYGWVSFSAPGICDTDNTYGFTFTPKQPPAAAKPQLVVVPGRPGCYRYTAVAGDYPEGLASQFGVKLQQLLLDNLAVLQDPSTVPPGAALLLCGISSAALAGAMVTTGAPAGAPMTTAPAPVPAPAVKPPPAAVKPSAVVVVVVPRKPPAAGPVRSPLPQVTPAAQVITPMITRPQVVSLPSQSAPGAPGAIALPIVLAPAPRPGPAQGPRPPPGEVAALLDIKKVLDPPGTVLTDWQPGSADPCGWVGVYCAANKETVVRLDFLTIAGRKFEGRLPTGALLQRLPALKAFALYWVLSAGGPLPPDWSQLTRLVEITLLSNHLTGGPTEAERGTAGSCLQCIPQLFVGTHVCFCVSQRVAPHF